MMQGSQKARRVSHNHVTGGAVPPPATLKWNNLKINKCPQCDREFGSLSFSVPKKVSCFNCHFTISERRFSEIVNSKITADLERKWELREEE